MNQVAQWADNGTAMIGHKSLGLGNIIAINMQVITSDTAFEVINQPWATQLFVNAVEFQQQQAVPEPITATLGLMGLGVLGMVTRRRMG